MPEVNERTTPALRVGFVGLGDQGGPMARAVAEAGHSLHTWVRRPDSLQVLAGVSHTVHDHLADLASECDVICLCLPEDSDVRSVVFDKGLLANMKPGAVLVNQGTGLPQFAVELAKAAAPRDIAVLDAPVSGGRAAAVAKTLTTMVGGDHATAEKCRGVFESFSANVVYLGSPGTGQVAKLLNNTLMMMNQRNIEEVLALAAQLDLGQGPLLEALGSGSASSVALQALGTAITLDNAAHLQSLELIDMDLFAAAMAASDIESAAVTARAVAGAQGLTALMRSVSRGPEGSGT